MVLSAEQTFADATSPNQHLTEIVRPVQVETGWSTLILSTANSGTSDNGCETADDTSPITDPTTQITLDTRRIFNIDGRGTVLLLRFAYDSGITLTSSPIVEVFGRHAAKGTAVAGGEGWMRLGPKDTTAYPYDVTLTIDLTNDVTDGTLGYTETDPTGHAFDVAGCNQILVGVVGAFSASAGTVTNCELQGKVI